MWEKSHESDTLRTNVITIWFTCISSCFSDDESAFLRSTVVHASVFLVTWWEPIIVGVKVLSYDFLNFFFWGQTSRLANQIGVTLTNRERAIFLPANQSTQKMPKITKWELCKKKSKLGCKGLYSLLLWWWGQLWRGNWWFNSSRVGYHNIFQGSNCQWYSIWEWMLHDGQVIINGAHQWCTSMVHINGAHQWCTSMVHIMVLLRYLGFYWYKGMDYIPCLLWLQLYWSKCFFTETNEKSQFFT